MITAIRKLIREWRINRIQHEIKQLRKEKANIDHAIHYQNNRLSVLQMQSATPARRRNPGAPWLALR